MTLRSHGSPRSSDKLKPLYIYYPSVYGHQTWQDVDLHRVVIHKVKFFGHMVSCDILKPSYLYYRSVYGYHTRQVCDLVWGASPINLVTWLFNHVVKPKTKNVISLLPRYLWSPNLLRVPTNTVTWFYSHMVLWGHVTNQILYISASSRPTVTKQ